MALDHAKLRKLGGYCGIAAVAVYVLCSLVAFLQYPVSYNPFDNWISDLGNYDKNPSGALIFNAGSALAGLLLVPFFIGLAAWYYTVKKNKYFYVGAELFGFVSAFGLVMLGIFQEGTSLHVVWALLCFGMLIVVQILASLAVLKNPKLNKLVGYYGFLGALVGLVFFVMFAAMTNPPIIVEWAAVYAGFLWVVLFSLSVLFTGYK